MNRTFLLRWWVSLPLVVGLGGATLVQGQVASWFESAPTERSILASAPAVHGGLFRFTGSDAARRSMPGERWSVPLPGEPSGGVVVIDSVWSESPGSVLLTGRMEGHAGSMVLMSVHGDRAAVTVRRPARDVARIQPSQAGWHLLEASDSDHGPRCANESEAGVRIDADSARRGALAGVRPVGTVVSTLDVAFLYTRAALAGAGGEDGMRALVSLAVLESNDAYVRSEAQVRLRTVALQVTDYDESGVLATDLSRLSRAGDGYADEAQRVRDEAGADLVCLVTEWEESNQFAGMANQLLDTSAASVARGFTACLRPYLVGNYTLAHEVGHLLGCNHDRDHAATGLDPWSYGTRITVDGAVYRTVMAYRPGFQFPHFSNPRVLYRGVATGVASGVGAADNVRTMNTTAPLMAAVREPSVRGGFGAATAEALESSGVLRLPLVWSGQPTGGVFRVRAREGTARAGVDFATLDREIAWGAGEWAPREIALTLFDNAQADGPRRLTVELLGPVVGLALGPVTSVHVTIGDDELESMAAVDTSARVRPGADYLVSAVLAQPDGVVVGGGFTRFGGERRERVARVLKDGTVDPGFAPVVKYRVDALADLGEGRVALGGEFNTVDGVRLNHVAVVRSDGRLDSEFVFDPGADLRVLALVASGDGGVYAGGEFETVGDSTARRVVRLDSRGDVVPEFETSDGPDGVVHALAWDRGGMGREAGLLVAGRFRKVGDEPHRGVVRLRTDGSVDPNFTAGSGIDGTARALGVDESGGVVVAGDFREACGGAAGAMIRLTPNGQVDSGFRHVPGANAAIFAVARANGGGWWVGGAFTEMHGVPRRHVALLREDGGVDERFDPGVGPDDWVLALAQDETGALWIGGSFQRVCGVERGGLARLLDRRPAPARFLSARVTQAVLGWEAEAAPLQRYEVEVAAGGSRTWRAIGTRTADAAGKLESSSPATGAVEVYRLRRRLE